jgi:hypothetical protein
MSTFKIIVSLGILLSNTVISYAGTIKNDIKNEDKIVIVSVKNAVQAKNHSNVFRPQRKKCRPDSLIIGLYNCSNIQFPP